MNYKLAYTTEMTGYLSGLFGAIYLMGGEALGVVLVAFALALVYFGHKERKKQSEKKA